jgi:hypothetical protein
MRILSGFGWLAGGALTVLCLASFPTLGLPLLVLGVALIVARMRAGIGGDWWLALAGAGLALVVLGFLALPWQPCADGPVTVTLAPGETSSSSECGGLHPAFFFGPGALLLLGGFGLGARSGESVDRL